MTTAVTQAIIDGFFDASMVILLLRWYARNRARN